MSTHVRFTKLRHQPSFIYCNNENSNMRNNYSCHGEGVICINISKICDKDLKLLWIFNFTLPVYNLSSMISDLFKTTLKTVEHWSLYMLTSVFVILCGTIFWTIHFPIKQNKLPIVFDCFLFLLLCCCGCFVFFLFCCIIFVLFYFYAFPLKYFDIILAALTSIEIFLKFLGFVCSFKGSVSLTFVFCQTWKQN